MNDEDLAFRARSGDAPAREELARRFLRPVFAVCLRILHNDADAEDAAQETFVRLIRGFHRYEEGRRFAPWLFKMATNIAYDQVRSGKRRAVHTAQSATPPAVPTGKPDMARAIASLPGNYGLALTYKFQQGLSNDEIGKLLDIAPASVRVVLFRALSMIRERTGKTEFRS